MFQIEFGFSGTVYASPNESGAPAIVYGSIGLLSSLRCIR